MDELSSSYIPLDIAASVNEHEEGVQGGEPCGVDQLGDVFAWMRGSINGWYGWANDGKSEFRDFLKVIKAKRDGWKFCCFRPEDMDSVITGGKAHIRANRIYKNLAWNLTGKTWSKKEEEEFKSHEALAHALNGSGSFTTLDTLALNASGRYQTTLIGVNRRGFSHQFQLTCTTTDSARAPRLLGMGALWVFERELLSE